MRYANLIFGILLSAAAVSGCQSHKASSFSDDSTVAINRQLIQSLVGIIAQRGYDRDNVSADFDDAEYFDALKASMHQQYDQEYRKAAATCDRAWQNPVRNDIIFAALAYQIHAGRHFDDCMLRLGWESGTRRMYHQITDLAWQEVQRARKSAAIAAKASPKGANAAERVFENTWRSVVVIKSGESQGSGVIVRPNVVATNCHVVDGGRIVVYKTGDRRALTDSSFAATIRKRDTQKDFCLLDVAGLWGVPANIRAYNTLKVGEDVYALGAPTGLDLSLSSGVVSQLRKAPVGRVIQTDAAISPGSSGGGLFDSDGNLVGITTAKRVAEDVEGIGFAIPADLATKL